MYKVKAFEVMKFAHYIKFMHCVFMNYLWEHYQLI